LIYLAQSLSGILQYDHIIVLYCVCLLHDAERDLLAIANLLANGRIQHSDRAGSPVVVQYSYSKISRRGRIQRESVTFYVFIYI